MERRFLLRAFASDANAWLPSHRQALKRAWRQTVAGVNETSVSNADLATDGVKTITSNDRAYIAPDLEINRDGQELVDNEMGGENAALQAKFVVHSAGLGSMLVVKMPPLAHIYTRKGVVIGQSESVATSFTSGGSPLRAVMRRLGGGPFFFQQMSTQQVTGDVMMAPKAIGDIAAIDLDGSSEMLIRRHSFLASTSGVCLSMRLTGLRMSKDTGIVHYRVSGKGKVAITTYGGLYRLVLNADEKYLVSPKHLIAWDASMIPEDLTPKTIQADNEIKAPISATTNIKTPTSSGFAVAVPPSVVITNTSVNTTKLSSTSLSSSSIVKETTKTSQMINMDKCIHVAGIIARRIWNGIMIILPRIQTKLRHWVLGEQELVSLQGPGVIYMASRILPRFELIKTMTASGDGRKEDTASSIATTSSNEAPPRLMKLSESDLTMPIATHVSPLMTTAGRQSLISERTTGILGGVAGTEATMTTTTTADVKSGVQKMTKRV